MAEVSPKASALASFAFDAAVTVQARKPAFAARKFAILIGFPPKSYRVIVGAGAPVFLV
jgi:hypothetical protein